MSAPARSAAGNRGYRELALVLAVSLAFFSGYQGLAVLTPNFLESLDYAAVLVGASTTAFVIAAAMTNVALGFRPRDGDIRSGCVVAGLLLGVPCFVIPYVHDGVAILGLVMIRGVGLGIAGVLLGTAASVVVPAERRGLAVGLFTVVGAGIAVFAQAACLFIAGRFGFTTAFFATGVLSLVGILPLFFLDSVRAAQDRFSASFRDALQLTMLLPSVVFFVTSMTYGAVVSFGPERLGGTRSDLAVTFFVVLAVATSVSRLVAGWLLDRFQPWPAMALALAAAAAALVLLGLDRGPAPAILSGVLYGVSFGVISTAGIVVLVKRVDLSRFGLAHAMFNFAGLTGLGLGGVAFGAVVDATDYGTMFVVAPCVLLAGAVALAADWLGARDTLAPVPHAR